MFFIAFITLLSSAFFSGVEIAFVSANKLQLELDRTTGKFPANIILYFSRKESDFITTMLIGNNISLVIYGVVMTKILTPKFSIYFDSTFLLLFFQTIITTIIVLVTAEFLPKAIFRIYSSQILKIFSVPIWIFFVLFRPIAILMLTLSDYILKHIFKQEKEKDKKVFGKTDLDEYISNIRSTRTDSDNRIEVEMLKNALDLSDKKIRECMIPRTEIVAMNLDSTINDLKSRFIETKLSKILIYKGNIDNIIGYIHSSELFRNPKNIRASLLPIPFVPESMSAMELLNQFIENDKGVSLVVDEFGGTSGLITLEDITEEIVGEIVDEYDEEEVTDIKISERKFKFLARVDVEFINKKYNLKLPDSDEYETIAGLILYHQEHIPNINDEVLIDNFKFTIIDVNQTTIQEVQLELINKSY